MTITQALALRPGQRVCDLHPDHNAAHGRVISNGRKIGILWDNDLEEWKDHRYMHYVHVLVETAALAEA